MTQFKVGDTVRLKSGGPVMTVVEIGVDGFSVPLVGCKWFVDMKAEADSFPMDSVEAAQPHR